MFFLGVCTFFKSYVKLFYKYFLAVVFCFAFGLWLVFYLQ